MSESVSASITQFVTQYAQIAFGLGEALANNNGPAFQAQATKLLETAYNLEPGEKERLLQFIGSVPRNPYENTKNILDHFRSQGLLPPAPDKAPNDIKEIGRLLSQDQPSLTTSGHISLYLGCWRYLENISSTVVNNEFTPTQHTDVRKDLGLLLGVMPFLGLQDNLFQPVVASVVKDISESLAAEAGSFAAEIYPENLRKFLEVFRQASLVPAKEDGIPSTVEFLWGKNRTEKIRKGFAATRNSEASRTRGTKIEVVEPEPVVPASVYPFVDAGSKVVMVQARDGSVVLSDFVFKKYLAEGGMSRALVVDWHHDGRVEEVVLKYCMRDESHHQEIFINDCERQRGFAGKIDGYVPLSERGKLSDGKPFAIYPLMEQGDGSSQIERMRASGARYQLKDARELMLRVLQILAGSHAQGVANRDIKPDNILFNKDGMPYVNDCGLAVELKPDTGMDTNEGVGTLRYLPPEFIPVPFVPQNPDRLPPWWTTKITDFRQWDVFSAALTFFEFLTRGLHPYISDMDSLEDIFPILNRWCEVAVQGVLPVSLKDHCPELCEADHSDDDILARLKITRPPHYLEHTLAKGMALNPAERYRNASEFHYAVLVGEAQDKIALGRMILGQVAAAYKLDAEPDLLKRTSAQESEDIERGIELYTTGMQALEDLHRDNPRIDYFRQDILNGWEWLYTWSDPLGRVDLMKKAQEHVESIDPDAESTVYSKVHEQFAYVGQIEGKIPPNTRFREIYVVKYERRAGRWIKDPNFKMLLKQMPDKDHPMNLPRPLGGYYEIVVRTDRTAPYSGPLSVRGETLTRLQSGGMAWVSGTHVPFNIPFIDTLYFPPKDLVPGGMNFEWVLAPSGNVPAQQVYNSYAELPPVWLDPPDWLKGKQVMKEIPRPFAFRASVAIGEYWVYCLTLPQFGPDHSAWPRHWTLINPSGPVQLDNICLDGMLQETLQNVLDRPVVLRSENALEGYLTFLNREAQAKGFVGTIRLMNLDELKWVSKVAASRFPWGDDPARAGDADLHTLPRGVAYHKGPPRQNLIPRSLADRNVLDLSVFGRALGRAVPHIVGNVPKRFAMTPDLQRRLAPLFGIPADQVENTVFVRGGNFNRAATNDYDAIQALRPGEEDYGIPLAYDLPPEALRQQ